MITETLVSESAQRFQDILQRLQKHSDIQMVVLCTADGLPISRQASEISQMAAVAGFLLSAAKQSGGMLQRHGCQEVSVHLSDDTLLICRPFLAGEEELILVFLVPQQTDYKRLMLPAIRAFQEAVES